MLAAFTLSAKKGLAELGEAPLMGLLQSTSCDERTSEHKENNTPNKTTLLFIFIK
jgi:hypothetical protein